MEYTDNDLKKIYKFSINDSIPFIELKCIQKELKLICDIMDFDSFILQDIINTLLYFKNLNILNKVNNESIALLRQIVYGNKYGTFNDSDVLFIDKYLRYLLLPFNYNRCDKEYNLDYFLGEMDIFINLINENLLISDYTVLNKYNHELFEIVGRFYQLKNELEISNIFLLGSLHDKLILSSTLSHLSSLLYLSLDMFDNQYDLLNKTWENILENVFDYLYTCQENDLYQNLVAKDDEIKKEYETCLNLLKQTHNPPIKIKRS